MFIYKDGNPTIEPKMLFVPEFRKIWDRDKTANKKKASKELAFIYFTADFRSEYNSYGFEKEELIAEDIMGDPKYKADDLVLEAIARYETMQETYSMRYLKSTHKSADSLMQYYEDHSYKGKGDKNFSPDKLTKALKEVEAIMVKIEKWDKKVQAEEENMQIRGGGKVGMFEDQDTATWIRKGQEGSA
ncbi:MAG: hypothetical protein ACW964_02070 [Candidatus Hodarchaeales archaeon]|jgi:hypothetical protein